MEYVVGKHPCFPSGIPIAAERQNALKTFLEMPKMKQKQFVFQFFDEGSKNTYSFSVLPIGRGRNFLERVLEEK